MSVNDACRLFEAHAFTVRQILGYSLVPYRRDGRRLLAPAARHAVETRLAGNRALLPMAGSFILVATPASSAPQASETGRREMD